MPTLLELRTRARQRADMVASTFVEDDELTVYINDGAAELYDIIVSAYEDYYTIIPAPEYTVASGDNILDLPSDFYKLRGVDYKNSSTDYLSVGQYQFVERNKIQQSTSRRYLIDAPVSYRVIGNKLNFLPVDQAAGTYRLWYIPRFTELVDNSDLFDGINGWEDYIIVSAAIKMLAKEETDVNILIVELAGLEKRIIEMSIERDVGAPERISDVYNTYDSITSLY